MTYAYPAIFEYDKDYSGYCVYFPDLKGVVTNGKSFKHALDMAEDVLCLALYSMEQDGDEIPMPSKVSDIKVDNEDDDSDEETIVNLVACDTQFYKNYFANKSVKVNTTLPLWLKEEGERKKVNFSQLLQQAVKQQLNLL